MKVVAFASLPKFKLFGFYSSMLNRFPYRFTATGADSNVASPIC